MLKDRRKSMGGFTLVELLAVIVIISIIIVVGVWGVNKVTSSSRERAKKVSYEAIMKSAEIYVKEEYYNDIVWENDDEDDVQFFCVPVLELINMGYLKKEEVDNYDHELKFIKVKRYISNKTIFSFEEIIDDDCN